MRSFAFAARAAMISALLSMTAMPAVAASKEDRARAAIAEAQGKIDAANKTGVGGEAPRLSAEAEAALKVAKENLARGHKSDAIAGAIHASALADQAIGEAQQNKASADAAARADAQAATAAAQQDAANANARAAAAAADAAAARAAPPIVVTTPAPAPTTTVTTETVKSSTARPLAAKTTTKKRTVRRTASNTPTRASTVAEKTTTTVTTTPN